MKVRKHPGEKAYLDIDYRTVRETLDDFAQNPDSNSRREALTDSKMKAFEDKTWDEEILTLTKNGDKIDKILDQITKMKV